MVIVLRTELIEVGKNQCLSLFCHQVKNLYNRANYLVKQRMKDGIFTTYYDLDSILKTENCCKILPAHSAQHTLKLIIRNWKAYFRARKEWKIFPEKFISFPRPPKYKSSKGEQIAIISNQQARIENGWLKLPKKVNFSTKTRLNTNHIIREVRIIPRGIGYTIEIVYQKNLPKSKKKNIERKGAIDLGITNLVTYVDNIGSRPIIIKDEGKGVKSITQYYLKEVSKLQEQYAQQQRNKFENTKKLSYGSSYYHLKEKWRRKIKDAFHKLSKYLVDLWNEKCIHSIVIGYNPKWKQQVRLRKKTTQLFVIIPFHYLIRLLTYKAAEQGISVELVDESHTSKCSFLDNESICHHTTYLGKRLKRGLFLSSQGIIINSDVNAAYNILIKSDPQALPRRRVGEVGGYVIYPFRLSYQTLTSNKEIANKL